MNDEVTCAAKPQDLTGVELVARLDWMRTRECGHLVEFLLHLAEVDRRHLSLELGFPSLWAFCVQHLRLSNGAAFRRITACRLLARFPAIAGYLTSLKLCLTTLCLLKDVLDDANHFAVLERAAGQTEDQIRLLVATLRPHEAPPDLLRRLPAPRAVTSGPEVGQLVAVTSGREIGQLVAVTSGPEVGQLVAVTSGPEVGQSVAVTSGPEVEAREPARQPDRVRPVNAEQHVLRVTIGAACRAELDQVLRALSHKVPDGNLEAVLRECFQTTLKACARRRGQVARPRREGPQRSGRKRTRYIPAPVRREVWRRDDGRCTFVGTDGRRCESQHQVELDHHDVPYALGGGATASNLTLRCRAHNQHGARAIFGTAWMARFGVSSG